MGIVESWALNTEAWVVIGVVLVLAEIFLGTAHVVLSIGLAAFAISGLLYGQEQGWLGTRLLIETWRGALIWFAILSVASIVLVRVFARTRNKDDVNTY